MKKASRVAALMIAVWWMISGATLEAQNVRQRQRRTASAAATSPLNGVYRIDISASDKLYTVVAGASSNLPFGEQQRFFIDLAVRLTPPDLLAVERRGRRVSIGSSRAPRITLVADGVMRSERTADGHVIRTRIALDAESLTFTSSGRTEDNFSVIFASSDDGQRLRVTRRISAAQLNEPVIIQTVYNKISDTPRWDIYDQPRLAVNPDDEDDTKDAPPVAADTPAATSTTPAAGAEITQAAMLRRSLDEWIAATNARNIERQMFFYMPELKAFYLTRNVTRAFVRAEKGRVFTAAGLIDIRAAEPEIIFTDGGRTAIMRFRKKYRIENGRQSRRGEVVQELRWRRTAATDWKIFSERDIRVIR